MFWYKKKSKKGKLSLIVTCMDREEHLLISLRSWLDLEIVDDVVVVDWSSESKLYNNSKFKKILNNDKVLLLEVQEQKYFSLSKSLNLAVDFTSNEVILKVDSDYICTDPSWIEDLEIDQRLKKQGSDYIIHGIWQFNKELSGLCLFNKSNFPFYREELKNWGWEEIDMYRRMKLKNKNLIEILFFNVDKYVSHIPHSNNMRTKNYEEKDLNKSNRSNIDICYDGPQKDVNHNLSRQKYEVSTITKNYKKIKYVEDFYPV